MAVVAAARKLGVIGWQMLTKGEPYRYAMPRATGDKLSRLRVRATGQRRRGVASKGRKTVKKLPAGTYTVRSLSGVSQNEGLPLPGPLSAGERRTVQQAGCESSVCEESLP